MTIQTTTECQPSPKMTSSRRNLASKFLLISIASSLLSSSRAFVNQPRTTQVHLFDRSFGIVSTAGTSTSSLFLSSSVTEDRPVQNTNNNNNNEIEEEKRNVIVKLPVVIPPSNNGQPVMAIHTTQQFLHLLETAPTNGLVVIKYHAKFCKVCARVIIKFKKMAHTMENEQTPVPIQFADVELTANAKMCATLGIKKFPFLQIYRNTECIASFGTGPAHNFQRAVGGTIKDRLATTEEEWEVMRADLKEEIEGGQEELRLLRLDVEGPVEVEEEFSEVDGKISNEFTP
mmetsp:Transcript_15330/g.18157  ORF Transcript_15330/g.18157 Transcript_15330/m.18157 type:complete len:288 (+) Transcript_15330:91-954(+)